MNIACIFGTRPEAIKMAPVIQQLRLHPDKFTPSVWVTAQHREMLDQVLALFGIQPDLDLDLMQHAQTPMQVAALILQRLEPHLANERPDWVLVQGDTTTVMATALVAYHLHIKVGHIEAGLRTHDKLNPFPEEMNRVIADALSDLHFAPTPTAQENLLREGVSPATIRVTGNTVIDALQWIVQQPPSSETSALLVHLGLVETQGNNLTLMSDSPLPPRSPAPLLPRSPAPLPPRSPAPQLSRPPAPLLPSSRAPLLPRSPAPQLSRPPAPLPPRSPAPLLPRSPASLPHSPRLILVTAHRRENFGQPMRNICAALREIATTRDDIRIVYPVHLNPNVQQPVNELLADLPNVTLLPPVDYLTLAHLLKRCYLVLTDSGGLQEEAPSLAKPVLVLRSTTERPEAITAGTARLVGTDPETITRETFRLLDDPVAYQAMAHALNPFGDGHAAERIVSSLLEVS